MEEEQLTREALQDAAREHLAVRTVSQWCHEEYEMAGKTYSFDRQGGVWVLTQEGDA